LNGGVRGAFAWLPAGATAKVTAEDRAFARAVERYDAAVDVVFNDPAALAAVRARQQSATACLDTATSLGATHSGAQLAGLIVYQLYAIQPLVAELVSPAHRYVRGLRRLHLHNRTLRSARAVEVHEWGALSHVADAVLADFCSPMRAWQSAGFAKQALPPEMDRTLGVAADAGNPPPGGEAKLKRAAIRLRAAGVPRAVRARFVASGPDASKPILKGDPVLPAIAGS
jgi:hypothetical protein